MKGNAGSPSSVAREFFLAELGVECATFSVSVNSIASLSDRFCNFERRVSSLSILPSKIEEEI
jgi:hypothetical protein